MFKRIERLIETFIAKKYVAWGVSCWFLWQDKITGTDWVLLTAGIFAIDAYTKKVFFSPEEQQPVQPNLN